MGKDPLLAPSPQLHRRWGGGWGVGQASPQGISGPIPPPSPHLGLAAVNELHGDPGAPRTQGTCPELGLYWGGGADGGWGREKERAEKGEKETDVEKRENGQKRRGGGRGMGEDGQSQEKEERERKRKQWIWKNQRETATKTEKNQETHREPEGSPRPRNSRDAVW